MRGNGGSWTRGLISFALAVLLAGWALNKAASLVLQVWPVLFIAALLVAVPVVLLRFFQGRDRW